MHREDLPLGRGRAGRLGVAAVAVAVVLLPCARFCLGETVTLQQGLNGYAGCETRTLWGKTAKRPPQASDACLYMRGTSNRLLVKFRLPERLRGQRLARARLEVFLPEVKNLRMINETLCREVKQAWGRDADWTNAGAGRPWVRPGGTVDVETDYGRGRPKGAVDSYSLWEYDGRWFPHKYRFLGFAKGGKWVDFNVTPLARKWLKSPQDNHGVALEPIDQADKRFPNRLEADIPAATHPDAAHRPRLILEFAPLDEPYLVGMTHGLRKYCDKSTRFRFFGPFEDSYEMEMARNEFEPFQVLVYSMLGKLKKVTFEWTDLVDRTTGATIPRRDIEYNVQEVVKLHRNGKINDWYFHGKNFEMPDPLSTARPVDVPEHMATPFWFIVRTRPETKPGTYRGRITVKADGAPSRQLDLTVKVWKYKIPERWYFQTMGQCNWSYFWRNYDGVIKKIAAEKGKEAAAAKRAQLHRGQIDFLMDHRFMPTSQYTSGMGPTLAEIPYCVGERGGNTIYLHGNFRLPNLPGENSPEVKKLRAKLESAKEALIKDAGRSAALEKLEKDYEAAKAEARKIRDRAQRASRLGELREKFDADKAALIRASGKSAELGKLVRGYEAERAKLMAKLTADYEAAKDRALKVLRDRCDAVIALDKQLRSAGKLDTPEQLIDMSLVYIGDETSDWELMRRKSEAIRLACPELMIMIGGSFPRKELDGIIDIYDPQIGGGSKTYSLTEEMTHLIAQSQAKGERFFWYDAAGPMLPYPNVQCEEPLIASRAVFWMTWKYGVTGFEYYCYSIWSHNLPGKDGKRWPEKPFSSWGWGDTNGDGMLYYPGPDGAFSSVRFENIRDGIEDWESHLVLRDYKEAVEAAVKANPALAGRAEGLLRRADALLKVPEEVCKDLKTWTWEPNVLLKARRDVGETIDALAELVPEKQALAVRRARKASEIRRQRAMLARRAALARESIRRRNAGGARK